MFCDGCGRYLGWGEAPPPETIQVPTQPPQPGGPRATVQVTLSSDLIEVAPGNAKSATFSIKNLGIQVEEFRLSRSLRKTVRRFARRPWGYTRATR